MSFGDFIRKQFIDVIDFVEPEDGILSYRYPMQDREIQNGAKLTVRESQVAAFINEGLVADIFTPGLYTLNTQTLPVLTYLRNWDKFFQSPFKSDVYFFSTRLQLDQRFGTPTPITIRDKEFGAIRLRSYGIYTYRIEDAQAFYTKVSGTRDIYRVADLEGQLRNTILANFASTFAQSEVPFLDMAANQGLLSERMTQTMRPVFKELGLHLEMLAVQNLSLPDELQKRLDERISMNMVGDMNRYTQYQAAQAIPIAAANEGGAAGAGVGLGAGIALGQSLANAMRPPAVDQPPAAPPAAPGTGAPAPASPQGETKFCVECGKPIPKRAKFCPECGTAQQ